MRCLVATNRLVSANHLQLVNSKHVEQASENSAARNRMALFVWTASQLVEMRQAIVDLQEDRVERKLGWAEQSWRNLVGKAERWDSTDFQKIRHKVGFHADAGFVERGVRRLSTEPIPFLESDTSKGQHLYFVGADSVLMQGLWGASEASRVQEMMTEIRDDSLEVPALVSDVLQDLAGFEDPN